MGDLPATYETGNPDIAPDDLSAVAKHEQAKHVVIPDLGQSFADGIYAFRGSKSKLGESMMYEYRKIKSKTRTLGTAINIVQDGAELLIDILENSTDPLESLKDKITLKSEFYSDDTGTSKEFPLETLTPIYQKVQETQNGQQVDVYKKVGLMEVNFNGKGKFIPETGFTGTIPFSYISATPTLKGRVPSQTRIEETTLDIVQGDANLPIDVLKDSHDPLDVLEDEITLRPEFYSNDTGTNNQFPLGTLTSIYQKLQETQNGQQVDVYKKVGEMQVNENGKGTFTPEAGFTGQIPFSYTIKGSDYYLGSYYFDESDLETKEPVAKLGKPKLRLGASVDFDENPHYSANALGDDDNDENDEATLTEMMQDCGATISVYNDTGKEAHLYYWMDKNNNKTFQDDTEFGHAIIPVPDDPTKTKLVTVSLAELNFQTEVTQQRFVRFRLTSEDVVEKLKNNPNFGVGNNLTADELYRGIMSDGEVEDVLMTILVPTMEVNEGAFECLDGVPQSKINFDQLPTQVAAESENATAWTIYQCDGDTFDENGKNKKIYRGSTPTHSITLPEGKYSFKLVFNESKCETTFNGQILKNEEKIDHDGDGILDICDMDDDNDGILDSEEGLADDICKQAKTGTFEVADDKKSASTTLENNTNPLDEKAFPEVTVKVSIIGDGEISDTTLGGVADNFSKEVAGASAVGVTLPAVDPTATELEKRRVRVEFFNKNGEPIKVKNPTFHFSNLGAVGTTSVSDQGIATTNGTAVVSVKKASWTKLTGTDDLIATNGSVKDKTADKNNVESAGSLQVNAEMHTVELEMKLIGHIEDEVKFAITACLPQDTDQDGIPDYLDLDSDGDGCPDAIEGGSNNENNVKDPISYTDLQDLTDNTKVLPKLKDQGMKNLKGAVGQTLGTDYGVPTSVVKDGNVGQTVGSSQDPDKTVCNIKVKEDINQTVQGVNVDGNVLHNDGEAIKVTEAKYYDKSGNPQTLPIGTKTKIWGKDKDGNWVEAGEITLNEDGTYTYEPNETFIGDVPIDYTAVNGAGYPDSTTLEIKVTPAPKPNENTNPLAQNDTQTVEQGKTVEFKITDNDSDPEGDTLTVTDATLTDGFTLQDGTTELTLGTEQEIYHKVKEKQPNGTEQEVLKKVGVLKVEADGTTTFTAEADFVGKVPFDYSITDGNGGTDKAKVTITVEPNNDTTDDEGNPVVVNDVYANDDAYITPAETPVSGTILNNDNIEGTPGKLTVNGTEITANDTEIDVPGKGKLKMNPDGTFTFEPEKGFVGTVVFPYEICNTDGKCAKATLYITVLPKAPNAQNDINQTPQNTPVDGNVLTNDDEGLTKVKSAKYYDAQKNPTDLPIGTETTVWGTDKDGNWVEAGTIKLESDGTYKYKPNATFIGDVPIDYVAQTEPEKGKGVPQTSPAKLDIKVIPNPTPIQPTAPVAQDDTQTVEQGGTVEFKITDNDSDPEGDTLTVTDATLTDGFTLQDGTATELPLGTPTDVYKDGKKVGTLTVNTDGTTSFTAEQDFVGQVPFDYTITDGNGGTDTAKVTITVVPKDAKNNVYANDDAYITPAETPVDGNIKTNDTVEGTFKDITVNGTPITADDTVINVPEGELKMNKDGSFTFTPTAGFVGTVAFPYEICNTDGECDKATLYITVFEDPCNQMPKPQVTVLTDCKEGARGTITNYSTANNEQYVIAEVGATSTTATIETDGTLKDLEAGKSYEVTVSLSINNGTKTCTKTTEFTVPTEPADCTKCDKPLPAPTFAKSAYCDGADKKAKVQITTYDSANTYTITPATNAGGATLSVSATGMIENVDFDVVYTVVVKKGECVSTGTFSVGDDGLTCDGTCTDTVEPIALTTKNDCVDGPAATVTNVSDKVTYTVTPNTNGETVDVTTGKVTNVQFEINYTITATSKTCKANAKVNFTIVKECNPCDEFEKPAVSVLNDCVMGLRGAITNYDKNLQYTYDPALTVDETGKITSTLEAGKSYKVTAKITFANGETCTKETTFTAPAEPQNCGECTEDLPAPTFTKQVDCSGAKVAIAVYDQEATYTITPNANGESIEQGGNIKNVQYDMLYTVVVTKGKCKSSATFSVSKKGLVCDDACSLDPIDLTIGNKCTATAKITVDPNVGKYTIKPNANGETVDMTTGEISNLDFETNYKVIATSKDPQCKATSVVQFIIVNDCKPEIELTKASVFNDANSNGFADKDETITYTFTIKNTGNTTVKDLKITDAKLVLTDKDVTTLDNFTPVSGYDSATNTLEVGGEVTFTKDYVPTTTDINAGQVENTATATGKAPNDNPVTDVSDSTNPSDEDGVNKSKEDSTKRLGNDNDKTNDPTVTILGTNPQIELKKEGTFTDENGNGFAEVGETVKYTFTVTNTGNVDLTAIKITDPKVTVSGELATLLVGESNNTAFTAVYTLTADDIKAGGVDNKATANATSTAGAVPPADSTDPTPTTPIDPACTDCTTVKVQQGAPAIKLEKEGTFNDENGNGFAEVGETVKYTFTVTNTGNVDLTAIKITDPKVTVSGELAILAVGKSNNTAFTAVYTLTAEDIKAGKVVNTAKAIGKDPNNNDVADMSDSTHPDDNDGGENADDTLTGDNGKKLGKDGDDTNDPTVVWLGNTTDATDDVNTTDVNTPVSGNVLTNDTDSEGHNQEVTSYTDPANGKVVMQPDGSYTYTPNKGFVGEDTFTYTVCDDGTPRACDTATVTITVKGKKTDYQFEDGSQAPIDDVIGEYKEHKDGEIIKGTDGKDYEVVESLDPKNGVKVIKVKLIKTDYQFEDGSQAPIDDVEGAYKNHADGSIIKGTDGKDYEVVESLDPKNGVKVIKVKLIKTDYQFEDGSQAPIDDVEGAYKNHADGSIIKGKDGKDYEVVESLDPVNGVKVIKVKLVEPQTPGGGSGVDTDGDGVPDEQEKKDGTNPSDPCDYKKESQDISKVSEEWKNADCDGDGVTNGQEIIDGTDPKDPCDYKKNSQDTSKVSDEWKKLDCDGDGVTNGQEVIDGTDPKDPCDYKKNSQDTSKVSDEWKKLDCDGDGVTNGQEVIDGTDPKDPCDYKEEHQDKEKVTNVCNLCKDKSKADFIKSIPQGFSPNGDTKNELFEVKDLENCYPKFRLRVYNRWGNLVFDSEKGNRKGDKWWDGYSNGRWNVLGKDNKVPAGTYFYILEFDKDKGNGKDNTHQGWVYMNY